MFRLLLRSVALMTVLFTVRANATEIDVAAYNAIYGNHGTPVSIVLGAGTYSITYRYTGAVGQYQGWGDPVSNFGQSNQAPAVNGCNGSGTNCLKGWTDSFGYTINGAAGSAGSFTYLGVPSSNANDDGQAYATTAQALLAYSQALPYTIFTLSSASTITSFVTDSLWSADNYGGVTLDVSNISEPVCAALLGLGLLGLRYIAHRQVQAALVPRV